MATQSVETKLKLLVFTIGKLNLALPVEYIQQVIKQAPVFGSGLSHTGVMHFKDKEITTIDLHKKLFKTSQTDESGVANYLILTTDIFGEEFGILVKDTPTLIDVPLSQMRALPESYRKADTLEIASHVSAIEYEKKSMTIFLLDIERLL
jgi:purine-binding chemotaxis protein CheW